MTISVDESGMTVNSYCKKVTLYSSGHLLDMTHIWPLVRHVRLSQAYNCFTVKVVNTVHHQYSRCPVWQLWLEHHKWQVTTWLYHWAYTDASVVYKVTKCNNIDEMYSWLFCTEQMSTAQKLVLSNLSHVLCTCIIAHTNVGFLVAKWSKSLKTLASVYLLWIMRKNWFCVNYTCSSSQAHADIWFIMWGHFATLSKITPSVKKSLQKPVALLFRWGRFFQDYSYLRFRKMARRRVSLYHSHVRRSHGN